MNNQFLKHTIMKTFSILNSQFSILLVAALVLFAGCKKDDPAPTPEDLTFANFVPDPAAAAGSTWTLTDERDNKPYVVKKMADGRIWMVQDLAFGDCTESSFHNDTSAAATEHAPTVAAGYVGHCRTNTQPGAGYLYNWPAVMQNRNAYYGSTDVSFACSGTGSGTVSPNPASCRGICPEGWHVPTGDGYGEFKALIDILGGDFANFGVGTEIVDNNSYHWHGVLGGLVRYTGVLFNQGIVATYWSCSNQTNYVYYLAYGNNVDPTSEDALPTRYGFSVRCVRNY
jgi:uncharacterized protein (TIGR02145 family)